MKQYQKSLKGILQNERAHIFMYCVCRNSSVSITIGINYTFSALFPRQRAFVFFITAIWWFLSEIQIECAPLYYSSSGEKWLQLSGPDAEFHVLVLSRLFCVVSGWGLLHGICSTVAVCCTLSDSLLSVLECLFNSSDVHICGFLILLRIADIFSVFWHYWLHNCLYLKCFYGLNVVILMLM